MDGAERATNSRVIFNDINNGDNNDQNNDGKARDDKVDTLGMTSDTSSLTLSWEGRPLEWSDARRNTEPCALFQLRQDSNLSESKDYNMLTTNHDSTTTTKDESIESSNNTKQNSCRFKTVIRVFHSETSLSKSQRLTHTVQNVHQIVQDYTQFIDSLELTDEILSHLGFWSGNLFLIAPFPDLCLLVPFYIRVRVVVPCGGPKKSPRTSI